MAIYIKEVDAVFLHLPKAGGSFVTKFLQDNFTTQVVGNKHDHLYLIPKQFQSKTTFTFVRSSESWYQSYWAFMMAMMNYWSKTKWFAWEEHIKWHPTRWIDKHCGNTDFNKFIMNCITKHPRFATNLNQLYASQASFVGRHEHLNEDLIKLFKTQFKIDVTEKVLALPKENATGLNWKAKATYNTNVLELLREIEA